MCEKIIVCQIVPLDNDDFMCDFSSLILRNTKILYLSLKKPISVLDHTILICVTANYTFRLAI